MKKQWMIGLGLALSVAFLNVNAQNTMDTKFGIKAGGNLMMAGKMNFAGTNYTSNYVPGFQAGAFLELPLSESLSFMPEVMYSQKGGKFEGSAAGTTGEIRTRTGYIDVPVLIGINAGSQIQFVLGPQASFLTNQRTETYVDGTRTTSSTDKENMRKSIAGGVAGVGFRLQPHMMLNARYNFDLQSAAKEDINQDKARYSGFALSLGYHF